jgi:hypothetical protein
MIGGRFGRRRRHEEGREAPIDPSVLERAAAALAAGELRRLELADVPSSFALLGLANGEGEQRFLIAASSRSGGDALLAAIAAQARDEAAGAEVVAAAPRFDAASRRRLGALRGPLRTLELGSADAVLPELPTPVVLEESLAAPLGSAAERGLFERAMAGLRGLAAKHGGATRPARGGLELVILARPVASLRAESERVTLEILAPDRATLALSDAGLVEALDRLEGGIRRRLADRHVQGGEEGLRGRLAAALAETLGLRFAVRWPFAGPAQGVDLVGVDGEGALLVGFARERLTLAELGAVLDAALAAEPLLPLVTREASGPVQIGERPRLALAYRTIDAAAEAVLARLALAAVSLRVEGDALRLASDAPRRAAIPAPRAPVERAEPAERPLRGSGEESPRFESEREPGVGRRRRRRRGRGRRPEAGSADAPREAEPFEAAGADEPEADAGQERFEFTLGSDEGEPAAAATLADVVEEEAEAPRETRALEFSLFDLGDEPSGPADEAARPQRRGRRRGRGRRGRRGGGEGGAADEDEPAPPARAISAPAEASDAEALDDDLEAELELSPDAPELEDVAAVPAYEEEEEGEPESELDRIRLERERRRRDRGSTLTALAAEPAGETSEAGGEPSAPRGRAAILAHADRDSIAAAVLLARDMRQLEGIWIYPQSELMTFFRGVATDLRDSTPIYVVGFVPRPSRDVLQAASLYRGRLVWFDHHVWPPEDLLALKGALGPALVRVVPGAGSSLPAVVPFCQRRSRFTDKFVDLICGRFTTHDFQRWGRLWWWRLGELAKKPGEHRAALELLIGGRPSDLARESERAALPPAPEEFAFVAGRDFRLVRFGGLGLVVAEIPAELDLPMTMRLVRERYAVPLSLARRMGSEAFALAADDGSARRAYDLGGMVQHLAEKFAWVDALPEDDHVARLRVHGVETQPGRLDELVAEIGMSRALLEG